MAKLKFKYLCRICGMKGFNKKVDIRNDCAHCEYSYVDDSNWDFFVEKGQTDGDTVLFDKLNIWQRILFIGEKKKKLLEKETGEKYQKIRDKIGYQDFLDNQSFLGKRGKIFSKNNQYLKYVSPNPQTSLKIKTTLKGNQDKYYSKKEKIPKKIKKQKHNTTSEDQRISWIEEKKTRVRSFGILGAIVGGIFVSVVYPDANFVGIIIFGLITGYAIGLAMGDKIF